MPDVFVADTILLNIYGAAQYRNERRIAPAASAYQIGGRVTQTFDWIMRSPCPMRVTRYSPMSLVNTLEVTVFSHLSDVPAEVKARACRSANCRAWSFVTKSASH